MGSRRRLSNRREHELIDFEHGGIRYTAGVGRFEDGTLAEIFLNTAKQGTAVDVNAAMRRWRHPCYYSTAVRWTPCARRSPATATTRALARSHARSI